MTEASQQTQTETTQKSPTQYVNYAFFKLDPTWRRLPDEERQQGKREFLEVAEKHGRVTEG